MSISRKNSIHRRQQLMEEALELFATKGYHATKVSEIVAKAGVAQGTFYWHFTSKEEIALAVLNQGKQSLLKVIEGGYRKEVGSVNDMMLSSKKMMTSLFQFASEHRQLMILIFLRGQGADSIVFHTVSQLLFDIEKAFERNMNRAMNLGMLDQNRRVPLQASMLTSLVTGTMARWLFGPAYELDFVPTESPEEMAEMLVRFEFYGLIGNE